MVLSSLWTSAVNHTPLVETGLSSPSFLCLALSAGRGLCVCMGKFLLDLVGSEFFCFSMSPILSMPMCAFLPCLVFHTYGRQAAVTRPTPEEHCPRSPGCCPWSQLFLPLWDLLSLGVPILVPDPSLFKLQPRALWGWASPAPTLGRSAEPVLIAELSREGESSASLHNPLQPELSKLDRI